MTYGLEILFYLLGIMSVLGVQWLLKLNRQLKPGGPSLGLLCVSLFLFVFAVAWSVSSVIENEMQAAGLGVVFFGLPSLVSFFLARRLYLGRTAAEAR